MPKWAAGFLAAIAAASAQGRTLVTVTFDTAPASVPVNFYQAHGLTNLALLNGNLGPAGGAMLTASTPPPEAPPPASGLGITPYANLAGFLSPFGMTFAPAVDYFSLWAFDGPQAFTVQAYRLGLQVGVLNVPAEPGRLSIELAFGAIGSATRIDRVVVTPVPGIGGSDPNRGPKYYDELSFNTVPEPGTSVIALWFIAAARRRR